MARFQGRRPCQALSMLPAGIFLRSRTPSRRGGSQSSRQAASPSSLRSGHSFPRRRRRSRTLACHSRQRSSGERSEIPSFFTRARSAALMASGSGSGCMRSTSTMLSRRKRSRTWTFPFLSAVTDVSLRRKDFAKAVRSFSARLAPRLSIW